MMQSDFLSGWVPATLTDSGDDLHCQWLYVGNIRFSEPFFQDTMLQCKQLHENVHPYRCLSSLELLPEWSHTINAISPTAFIFHVSRCGSTLLSQLLDLEETNRVLSEVPFLDDLLRLPYKKNGEFHPHMKHVDDYLKAAMKFFGQKRNDPEKNLFIKTDSWHLHFYNQIRTLYPGIPFIIITRSPDEIIRSQKKQRGMQSIPGVLEPEIFGFKEPNTSYDLDLYMSKVLETYFEQILLIMENDDQLLVVDFKEGLESITNQVLHLTGTEVQQDFPQKLQSRMLFHGKQPGIYFTKEEPEGKTPSYLTRCMELYARVKEKRKSSKMHTDKI